MKKYLNNCIITILLIIIILMLINNQTVIKTVIFSFDIWIKNVFPSLFPMFVITKILINYDFISILSKILNPLMKLFKTNKNCSFILAASMISGFPSSAVYANELLDQKIINNKDASKILTYSHFSNPMFIMGTIPQLLNCNCGLIILTVHYLTNFIIALIFRNYQYSNTNIEEICVNKVKKQNFTTSLKEAITSSIDTLLLILGTITITLILTNIITTILPIDEVYIASILEMTQGLKYLSLTNIDINLKITLATMIISFGGLSIFLQIKGVLAKHLINFKPFILARILHSIISGIIVYNILLLF